MSDTLELLIDDAALRPAWEAFLEARPEADVLQSWAWGEVTAVDGERPVRVAVRRHGELLGVAQVLVRASIAGRTVGYAPHGPVWRRDDPAADAILARLLEGIRLVAARERAIVVKVDPRALPDEDASLGRALAERGLRRSPHELQARTTRIVPLNGGGEALQAGWDTKARSRVRRAREGGVEVELVRSADPAAIEILADLLGATAAVAGFRARGGAYFGRLATALADEGRWLMAVARHEGVPIGVVATPRLGNRAFYLYGATRKGPAVSSRFPAYAALAGAMEGLAADGVATLDLWGVAEPGDTTADPSWAGFSEFKSHFRGVAVAHPGTWDLVASPGWDALRGSAERARDLVARLSGRHRA